jgi:hypothetical protein
MKKSQFVQSILFFVYYFSLLFFSKFWHYHSLKLAIQEVVVNCNHQKPGDYRVGPYQASTDWCIEEPQSKLLLLIQSLKSANMDATFASELGVNARVAYFSQSNISIINPSIVSKSNELIPCSDDIGTGVISKLRNKQVKILFLNERLVKMEHVFVNNEACLFLAIYELWTL